MSGDRLTQIFDMQLELQHKFGNRFEEFTPERMMDYIRSMAYACEDELHEATAETGWKPWASSNHLNVEAFQSELMDAFLFLMNLMLAGGMTPKKMMSIYRKHYAKSMERIANNYDGVSTKCVVCKREFTDVGVKCTTDKHVETETVSTPTRKGRRRASHLRVL